MKRIEVTCAVILKGDALLACQKGPDTDHPFEWEFPGGKIENGETSHECIIREIREELNLEIEILGDLHPVEFEYPNKRIKLIPFLCAGADMKIELAEHINYRWQPIKYFHELNWAKADVEVFLLNNSLLK